MSKLLAINPSVLITAATGLFRIGCSAWGWFKRSREQRRCALAAFAAAMSLLCIANLAAASIREYSGDKQQVLAEQLLTVANCHVSAVLGSCIHALGSSNAIASKLAPQVDRISSCQQQLRDCIAVKKGKAKIHRLRQADLALQSIIEAAGRAHALLWEQIVGEPPGDASLPP